MKPLLIYKDLDIISDNKPNIHKNLSWYIFYPFVLDKEFRLKHQITNMYTILKDYDVHVGTRTITDKGLILEGALLPGNCLEEYIDKNNTNTNNINNIIHYEYKRNKFYTIDDITKGKRLFVFYSFVDKALFEDTLEKFKAGKYSKIDNVVKDKILNIFGDKHYIKGKPYMVDSTYNKILNCKKEDLKILKKVLDTDVDIEEVYSVVDLLEETYYL